MKARQGQGEPESGEMGVLNTSEGLRMGSQDDIYCVQTRL